MSNILIPHGALLTYWQGHRGLTRRIIDAFPEDQLFTYSLGGMRPFGVMALELLSMGKPFLRGVATGDWDQSWNRDVRPKAEILEMWDKDTAEINTLWSEIPAERFSETATAFGQWTGPVYDLWFYIVDNEIHHRGQGYVYLRSLGIEPAPFYDR